MVMNDSNLSPEARAVKAAVLASYANVNRIREMAWDLDVDVVTAAILALADQVVPPCPGAGRGTGAYEEWMIADNIGYKIRSIATELNNSTHHQEDHNHESK